MTGDGSLTSFEAASSEPYTEPATYTVLTHLREQIVSGRIPPGSKLRAEALASEMNVSRTPVRSALAVLSAEGLVSYGVNRGYTVLSMKISDIFDAIEVRASLEGLAARLSVDLGWPPEGCGALQDLVERGRAILDAGAWSEAIERDWYALNRLFHRAIQRASQNSALRNAVRMTLVYPLFADPARICPTVADHVPPRLRQVPDTPPAFILASQRDHEAILDAIRQGDSEAAGRQMSDHVLATKARLHAIATR
ncbi:GntR family transcriptional regulator [Phenylobacterium sp.]|uniref:GntR family transcriptional regulator n=1 Tax=Phenylobacterium sp. TaxID=1871053 RepID=UPI00272FF1CA|nr:GntR family transcriptional regulator [Phenylobacterium sp.]MDP1619258.1 GntR family transcriptional regulator [Phenylobacterium sp.]MDP1989118.1 GntR family transcriptional regulator [Phenylobacterium sp.]